MVFLSSVENFHAFDGAFVQFVHLKLGSWKGSGHGRRALKKAERSESLRTGLEDLHRRGLVSVWRSGVPDSRLQKSRKPAAASRQNEGAVFTWN